MKIKNGFTLAEVLVTLSIIGILMTIVVPSMMNLRPNKELVMLKKAYSNTTKLVNELANDESLYPEAEDENSSGFSNTAHNGVYQGNNYNGGSKFCGLFAARLNNTSGVNCAERISLDAGGNFTTSDGVAWSMPVGNFNQGAENGEENIYIDIDGPNRGPNCTLDAPVEGQLVQCASGAPDRFVINVERFGRVSLPGPLSRLYVASPKTTKRFGEFAAEYNALKEEESSDDDTKNKSISEIIKEKYGTKKKITISDDEQVDDSEFKFWEEPKKHIVDGSDDSDEEIITSGFDDGGIGGGTTPGDIGGGTTPGDIGGGTTPGDIGGGTTPGDIGGGTTPGDIGGGTTPGDIGGGTTPGDIGGGTTHGDIGGGTTPGDIGGGTTHGDIGGGGKTPGDKGGGTGGSYFNFGR